VSSPKVLNAKTTPDWEDRVLAGTAVYVGRPSKWGNPHREGPGMTREEAVEAYRLDLLRNPGLLADLHEVRGMDLVCWCSPKPCHADPILYLANGPLA